MRIRWDFLQDVLRNKGRVNDGVGFQIWVLWAGLGSAGRLVALDMLGLKGHDAMCPQAELLIAAQ